MTIILFLIYTIYRNIFRCSYLTNKKLSPNFFVSSRNPDRILNILKPKITFIAPVFFNLSTSKIIVREISKKSIFRGSLEK